MASAYLKGGRWYLRFKDGQGRWKAHASTSRTKTEARRLATELEDQGERERKGLEIGRGACGELDACRAPALVAEDLFRSGRRRIART